MRVCRSFFLILSLLQVNVFIWFFKKKWNSKVLDICVFRHTNMRDQLIYIPSFLFSWWWSTVLMSTCNFLFLTIFDSKDESFDRTKSLFSQYVFKMISMEQQRFALLFSTDNFLCNASFFLFLLLDEQLFQRLGYSIHTRVYWTYGLVYQHRRLSSCQLC